MTEIIPKVEFNFGGPSLSKIEVVEFAKGEATFCQEVVPQIKEPKSVLIRVHYSPIMENDVMTLEHTCDKFKNQVLGTEGSGIIEDVSKDLDGSLRGRKCIFTCGAWAQYSVQKLDNVIILDDSVDLKVAANCYMNPMKALCLVKLVRESGCTGFVLDGADTEFGK